MSCSCTAEPREGTSPPNLTQWPTQAQEALYGALKAAVLATIEHSARPEVLGHRREGQSLFWAKEFRTVRFGVGRRMGHTTMAHRLAKELAPTRSIIFSGVSLYLRKDPEIRYGVLSKPEVSLAGFWADLIIVDCSSVASKGQLDKLMSEATANKQNPLFVLLQ